MGVCRDVLSSAMKGELAKIRNPGMPAWVAGAPLLPTLGACTVLEPPSPDASPDAADAQLDTSSDSSADASSD
ncbi:hypothetical protein BH09MYX1_BH09MYX1_40240 [soil metagenome]